MFPAPFGGWTVANAECEPSISNTKTMSSQSVKKILTLALTGAVRSAGPSLI